MSDKKHIDRVFQEKFKDFEATPSPEVWKNIQTQLDKKNKKRPVIIPLWYKVAGAAAILVLLLLGGSLMVDTNRQNINIVDSNNNPLQNNDVPQEKIITPKVESPSKLRTSPNSVVSAATNQTNSNASSSSNSTRTQTMTSRKNEVINTSNTTSATLINGESEGKTHTAITSNDSLKNNNENSFNGIKGKSDWSLDSTTAVSDKPSEEETNNTSSAIVSSETPNSLDTLENEALESQEGFEEAALSVSENNRRWAVRPNIAPIYYDGFGEGSTIDPQLADNSSSGDVSLSYGIQVSYEINENLKLRSGISQIKHSYTTNEIGFVPSTQASNLRNVNQKLDNGLLVNIIDLNSTNPRSSANPVSQDGEAFGSGIGKIFEGSLNQQIGYIEVPLELEYTLVNKRFGISVIGGASTLVLNENNISASSNGNVSDVGKANNINNLSFSTNVGLGLGYKISDRFQFSLEPTFKYQINTFNNTTDFNPYYLGLYSGFNFKF